MSAALLLPAAASAAAFPFVHLGAIGPIQSFGLIVAGGVLFGAWLLRLYAEWHKVSDDNIRALLTWVMVSGFLGAHLFNMVAYDWHRIGAVVDNAPPSWWFLPEPLWFSNWPLPLRIWDGISSFGGFIGGTIGFAIFTWWRRLPARMMLDVTGVGLLPAFSIGRIGCTVVSDHVGAWVDPGSSWAFLAMEYPKTFNNEVVQQLIQDHRPVGDTLLAWNLGLIEFLYLVPVNLLVLWIAFRPGKRPAAGTVAALVCGLYAPVRFFLEYLRPVSSDPRHLGLTFAQWSAMLLAAGAVYLIVRLRTSGKPAETMTPTWQEAQEKLRVILKEEPVAAAPKVEAKKAAPTDPKDDPIAIARREREAQEEAEAAERRRKQDEEVERKAQAAKAATAASDDKK